MNVVDSSGWLEYFAEGPNAAFFAPAIEAVSELIVPTLSLYEVFKRVLQQRGEGEALQAVAVMMEGRVVELTAEVALEAARLSVEMGLPMADSVMLATARAHSAELWTKDAHFAGWRECAMWRRGSGARERGARATAAVWPAVRPFASQAVRGSLPYPLCRCTRSAAMSAGFTPDSRDACPTVAGRARANFSFASLRSPVSAP